MTSILDELKKGRWPSFVKELEKTGDERIVKYYEKCLKDKKPYFGHGGIVGVTGYEAGVIGRVAVGEAAKILPEFHLFRILPPAGYFYTTDVLRKICDWVDKWGCKLLNFHGATYNLQAFGIPRDKLDPAFEELAKIGFDLGGSGPDVRTAACCMGPALCEWALIDTLDIYTTLMKEYIFDIHRPRFPYKFKIKISGCPNDCTASGARSDLAVIGIWRDDIKIDEDALKKYKDEELEMVAKRCPSGAITYKNGKFEINNDACTRCMYCINVLHDALKPGDDRGASILIGARARGRYGAFLAWVLVPFMKLEPPYKELKELIDKILDWWDEHGNPKERVGETIYRIGFGKFLKDIGIEPKPQMVYRPRSNPFWKYF